MKVSILSGGAAFGLIEGIKEQFRKEAACDITGEFGAVGLMKDKLLAGQDCDVLILSRKLIDGLLQDDQLLPESVSDLGVVSTGIALKTGQALVPVATSDEYRQALLNADKIMVPHMTKSTAGIHMKKVFTDLGIFDQIESRVQEYPNGATAMKALAESEGNNNMGCTQITEILYTPGVQAIGNLPPGCELDTVYTVAVPKNAKQADLALQLIKLLSDSSLNDYKNANGFKV